jgi:hypothetical protein
MNIVKKNYDRDTEFAEFGFFLIQELIPFCPPRLCGKTSEHRFTEMSEDPKND